MLWAVLLAVVVFLALGGAWLLIALFVLIAQAVGFLIVWLFGLGSFIYFLIFDRPKAIQMWRDAGKKKAGGA